MPGRTYTGSEDYRYGFNGKEMDDEVSGASNIYDYGFRVYNPRLGKFLSVDPLTKSYPWYTPYQFAGNKPVWAIDLDGLEELIYTESFKKYGDDIQCMIEQSAHLAEILESVSKPEKKANIKVYLSTSNTSFSNENGFTANAVDMAIFIKNFEHKYKEKINGDDMLWELNMLNDENSGYSQYLEFRDLFDENGISEDELMANSNTNPAFEAYIIVLKPMQFKETEGRKEILKTFFHEVELHLQRRLGVRENPDGKETSQSDHAYGHSFYENACSYEDCGYKDSALEQGYSPKKEDIVPNSPTGKTNAEIDKVSL